MINSKVFTFLVICFLGFSFFSQSKNTKRKAIYDLKGRTIIIATKNNNQGMYDNLHYAFQQEWKFSDSIIQQASGKALNTVFSTAKKYAMVQLKTFSLGIDRSIIEYDGDDMYVASGVGKISKLLLSTESGNVYYFSLPTQPDFSKEMFCEAVRRGVFMLNEIETEGSWNKAYKKLKRKYTGEMQGRTLLICNDIIENNAQKDKIEKMIQFDKQFVNNDFIDSVIHYKIKKYAYIVIGGENVLVNTKYICAAEDAKVLTREHSSSVLIVGGYQSDRDAKSFLRPQDVKAFLSYLK